MDAGENRSAMSADRRFLNPLYSDNRLKLGVFGANVSNGCAATTAAGHLEMTWPNSRDIVTTADRAGFEALVPVARWRGFGGATDFQRHLLRYPGLGCRHGRADRPCRDL